VSIPYCILIAVGPDKQELARISDLIDAVRAYESHPCHLVFVDDADSDRGLDKHFDLPGSWTAHTARHPRREFPKLAARASRGKGICAAILRGLATIGREAPEAQFTLKVDTDALVIAPFVEKLARLINQHPKVGMIGAYDRTPSGTPRDISKNAATVSDLYRGESFVRRLRNWMGADAQATISRHIGAAMGNGYQFGEHCLGGAYAVSQTLVARMTQQGYLGDPKLWLPIDCPEDVMVGIYTKAVNCDYYNFVAQNEVFGVRHRGLDDSPQRLLERGYSVIHAVKNDANFSEEQIRAFYREQRHGHGQQS
jgi:hypothetical protein